jgi:hypothetical protein
MWWRLVRDRPDRPSLQMQHQGLSRWGCPYVFGPSKGLRSFFLRERPVAEHRVDELAAAACQADDGGVVFLALGPFADVVGLGNGVMAGGDPDGSEECILEFLIAGAGREVPECRVTGAMPA